MQQFTVPQFIDVEDKIIGPLTTRQFLIMLFCFAIIGLSYKFFDFSLFLTISILDFCICGSIAFFKVNGMPMHFFILNFMQTKKRPPKRVWNNSYGKDHIVKQKDEEIAREVTLPPAKKVTSSRLSELSLVVDTRGVYKGENGERKV